MGVPAAAAIPSRPEHGAVESSDLDARGDGPVDAVGRRGKSHGEAKTVSVRGDGRVGRVTVNDGYVDAGALAVADVRLGRNKALAVAHLGVTQQSLGIVTVVQEENHVPGVGVRADTGGRGLDEPREHAGHARPPQEVGRHHDADKAGPTQLGEPMGIEGRDAVPCLTAAAQILEHVPVKGPRAPQDGVGQIGRRCSAGTRWR